MTRRVLVLQLGIFATQWVLMIIGFGILTRVVAPLKLFSPGLSVGEYFDSGIKALIALGLSVLWLFLWDRQVRYFFYRHNR